MEAAEQVGQRVLSLRVRRAPKREEAAQTDWLWEDWDGEDGERRESGLIGENWCLGRSRKGNLQKPGRNRTVLASQGTSGKTRDLKSDKPIFFFLNFILFYFLFLFVVDFDKPIFKLQLHHCLILETLFNLQVLISISGIIMSTQ